MSGAAMAGTVEERVALLPQLLELALGHILDSPACPAMIGVKCATCDSVLTVPTSGPMPTPSHGCDECPRLIGAATRWRREQLDVRS